MPSSVAVCYCLRYYVCVFYRRYIYTIFLNNPSDWLYPDLKIALRGIIFTEHYD